MKNSTEKKIKHALRSGFFVFFALMLLRFSILITGAPYFYLFVGSFGLAFAAEFLIQ